MRPETKLKKNYKLKHLPKYVRAEVPDYGSIIEIHKPNTKRWLELRKNGPVLIFFDCPGQAHRYWSSGREALELELLSLDFRGTKRKQSRKRRTAK